MRTIKFRGKSGYLWVFGNLQICKLEGGGDLAYIIGYTETPSAAIVDISTIGQFTGLHDKNGKEIYEGDVIRPVWTDYVGKGKNKVPVLKFVENCPPKVISYRDGAFGYVNFEADEYSEEEWLPILDYPCEVIGNIHDNPEILNRQP